MSIHHLEVEAQSWGETVILRIKAERTPGEAETRDHPGCSSEVEILTVHRDGRLLDEDALTEVEWEWLSDTVAVMVEEEIEDRNTEAAVDRHYDQIERGYSDDIR